MVRVDPDPYLVLGVPPTATQAEITHAYRTHLRAHHPDTRPARSAHTADEHLRQVLAAYALLRDPARRADYDRLIAHTADATAHPSRADTCWPSLRWAGPDPDYPPLQQDPYNPCPTATAAGRPGAPPLIATIMQNTSRTPESPWRPIEDRIKQRYQPRHIRPTRRDGGEPKPLLDEVRAQRRDAPGVERLRAIDTQTIRELQPISPPTYAKNCSGLALPLTSYTGLSDAELRIAHAQLMGWLEGLFKTMQPAVSSPDLAPATATSSSDSLFYRHEHLLQHQAPRKQALARRGRARSRELYGRRWGVPAGRNRGE
jgi:hypothetical protein